MIIRNKENNKCYKCNKYTMSYFPKEKIFKCNNCGFEFNFNKNNKEIEINYTELYGENGAWWIHFVKNIIFQKGNMRESIFMNKISMELLTKWKKHKGEICKINYIENKKEESLKDFLLSYENSKRYKFYEFTSIHECVIDTLKNAGSLVEKKFQKIKKLKKEKTINNFNFNLILDYIWDPVFQYMSDPSISPLAILLYTNPAGREKNFKTDLVKNCTKYLYQNTKRNGNFNKPWDLNFWNAGFNDILVIKFSINPFKNTITGDLWSLKEYINFGSFDFQYEFNKLEINELVKKNKLLTFDEFISKNINI